MTDSQGLARYVSQARAERLVAMTRLLTHGFGVLAAVVTARDYHSAAPLWLLLPWFAVSAVLLWTTCRSGRLFRPSLLLLLDLLVIAAVIAMTGGGTSPFFPCLLITPFSASILFGRRGMLWAGCGTLAAYLAIVAIATEPRVTDPRVVIIRLGVLVMIASVMIRRADHEQQTNADLERLTREAATNAERVRLSRDLHDGLLQSLGGLALHVLGARRSAASDPRATEQRLDLVAEQLLEAQRSLRDFVDGLRPELQQRRESLHARLIRAAEAIELQWDVPIDLEVSPGVDAVEVRLADDVLALVAEALTNAARHSGATRIRGAVAVEGKDIRVEIEDDGHGFPFHGRYELAQLVAGGHAPWSLEERVRALDGELAIESSPRGARVEMRLPGAG
ncbi:MAG TPA: sensor histidine kinase [Thermoanaerobaculia bacterium]